MRQRLMQFITIQKNNILMFTRKWGNEYVYEDCDDWELLWKHPKYYTEVDL